MAGGHRLSALIIRDREPGHIQKLDTAARYNSIFIFAAGAFIVRSGVLTSVHSFAVDPERGMYILIFLALVVGGSLLYAAGRTG